MHALSLEYHDVTPGDDLGVSGFGGQAPASYKLSLTAFERHLNRIASSVGRPPERAIDWTSSDAGHRPLFLTFDDGGVGAYTCIADALERRGWRGHFFVTAGQIGAPTFLSPLQVRELRDRGHVIGTHSFTHPKRMGGLTRPALEDEWKRSTDLLAEILEEPVLTGSVPGGFYTPSVGETAARAGLKVLFTSAPTTRTHVVDGCRIVGRYTLRHWSTPEQAAGLADGRWLPRLSQWGLYSFLNLARTVGGDHYTRVRDFYWAGRQ